MEINWFCFFSPQFAFYAVPSVSLADQPGLEKSDFYHCQSLRYGAGTIIKQWCIKSIVA
jgi:hypothetical protein